MRSLKFVFVFLGLIIAAAVAYSGLYFHSCLGRMQECYASFRSMKNGVNHATQERYRFIHAGFAASEKLVAFPVPLDSGSSGIILVSPETGRVRLISQGGYSHWSPQFSADGERLVFARGAADGERELVTCEVDSWKCSILFRTRSQLRTPFDVGNGYVLFSTNNLHEGDSTKSKSSDIFAVRRGERPIQLTDYEMYDVQSLTVAKGKILFGAYAGRGLQSSSCWPRTSFECDRSDIYALNFDMQQMKIHYKPDLLKPLFAVAGDLHP